MELGKYIDIVPKDFKENLAFRAELIRLSADDAGAKRDLWKMCARDPLFFLNAFAFTYNPRLSGPSKIVPFITYDFQDDMLRSLFKYLYHDDYLVEKSRDMGASWLCLSAFEHQWQFVEMTKLMCMSSKADLVDKFGDSDSMFWKVEFLIKNQPGWMQPNYDHNKMIFRNHDNGSIITGETTQEYAGTGGRNGAILLDEFSKVEEDRAVLAATRDNSDCRIFNSTPNFRGTNCAFYEQAQKMPAERKAWLHWTVHPDKAKGLYYDDDGKPRSPWYDKQCERANSKSEIAIELDIDYKGAESGFFDQELIQRLKADCAKPLETAELIYDEGAKNARIHQIANGTWRLWALPDENGKWDGEYVIGADVSYGKGATNSTMSVVNKKTGEKVASASNPHIEPHKWAELFVAACQWWNNAYGIWEANGPGRIFGDNVAKLGYRNFHYRRKEQRLTATSTEVYGWQNNQGSLVTLLGDYQKALRLKNFKNPDRDALDECLQYSFNKNGNIQHGGAVGAADPSGARENHGDMVVADALAWKGVNERPAEEEKPVEPETPYLSFQWRQEQRHRDRSKMPVWVTANAG